MNVVKTFTTQSFTIFPNFLDLYTRLVSNLEAFRVRGWDRDQG